MPKSYVERYKEFHVRVQNLQKVRADYKKKVESIWSLLQAYTDGVYDTPNEMNLFALHGLANNIVNYHKDLCKQEQSISWYLAANKDLYSRLMQRYQQLELELQDRSLSVICQDKMIYSKWLEKARVNISIFKNQLTQATRLKNKDEMRSLVNKIQKEASKITEFEERLRCLHQEEHTLNLYISMQTLLGLGGVLNPCRLLVTDEPKNSMSKENFLSESIFQTKMSELEHEIKNILALEPPCAGIALPNRDVALNVSLKKSLEIKEIVENKLKLLLQDLQFTDQDVQMLAVQLYNQARRLFKQNVHNMLDLNTLEYQLHERFNGNYDYSHAQINDVIKSQIMLITMFTHLFHQQS